MRESLPELRERLPGVRLVLAAMGPKMCALAGAAWLASRRRHSRIRNSSLAAAQIWCAAGHQLWGRCHAQNGSVTAHKPECIPKNKHFWASSSECALTSVHNHSQATAFRLAQAPCKPSKYRYYNVFQATFLHDSVPGLHFRHAHPPPVRP